MLGYRENAYHSIYVFNPMDGHKAFTDRNTNSLVFITHETINILQNNRFKDLHKIGLISSIITNMWLVEDGVIFW